MYVFQKSFFSDLEHEAWDEGQEWKKDNQWEAVVIQSRDGGDLVQGYTIRAGDK